MEKDKSNRNRQNSIKKSVGFLYFDMADKGLNCQTIYKNHEVPGIIRINHESVIGFRDS